MIKSPKRHPFSGLVPAADLQVFLDNDLEVRPAWFDHCATQDHGFDLETFFRSLRDTVWPEKAINFVPNGVHKTSPQLKAKMLSGAGQFTLDRIRAARAMKATISLIQYQRFHQGIREMMHAISESGFYSAKANIYFTPANAQGFLPHWDNHDVFVLQISGDKEWHVANEADMEHPTSHARFKVKDGYEMGEKTVRTLHAGQLLYVPRGYGHYAKALDTDSLHITIGVTGLHWSSILELLAEELMFSTPHLRRSITNDVMTLDDDPLDCAPLLDALKNITTDQIYATIQAKMRNRKETERAKVGQVMGTSLDDLLK